MSIYDRSQKTASRLLKQFDQGGIVYIKPGTTTAPEWAPVTAQATEHTVKATATGVQQKYIQPGYINASDIQCTVAVFDVAPDTYGMMRIDGRDHQIIQVDRIPAAGTVVAWRVFCKS